MTALPDFDSLWDYNDPAESERRFDEIVQAAARSRNRPYYLQLLTQIARAQGLQGNFDGAHRTLDMVQAALPVDERTEIRYLLERGRVFNSANKPAAALPLFIQAWERARAAGEDFYAVDAAHMLGIAAAPEDRLAWNEQALVLAESSRDPRAQKWQASLYNNIGWTYHDRGDYDRALTMFEKALVWRERHGQPREIRIARWCVARTLRSLNRVEEALKIQQSLLSDYAHAGEKDGYVFEELGECLLQLGRAEAAKAHFAAAYAELSADSWFAANEPARLDRLKTLGGV